MVLDASDGIEQHLRQRDTTLKPLQLQPQAIGLRDSLPNTSLAVSTIAFFLGSIFALGALTFVIGGFGLWWATYQLGFFIAAWAGFHWGEFVVTAGWNLEKCSVDCK